MSYDPALHPIKGELIMTAVACGMIMGRIIGGGGVYLRRIPRSWTLGRAVTSSGSSARWISPRANSDNPLRCVCDVGFCLLLRNHAMCFN